MKTTSQNSQDLNKDASLVSKPGALPTQPRHSVSKIITLLKILQPPHECKHIKLIEFDPWVKILILLITVLS